MLFYRCHITTSRDSNVDYVHDVIFFILCLNVTWFKLHSVHTCRRRSSRRWVHDTTSCCQHVQHLLICSRRHNSTALYNSTQYSGYSLNSWEVTPLTVTSIGCPPPFYGNASLNNRWQLKEGSAVHAYKFISDHFFKHGTGLPW